MSLVIKISFILRRNDKFILRSVMSFINYIKSESNRKIRLSR